MNPPAPARPWLRIIVRSLLLLVILLATAGFLYENISETRDRRFNPMPGQIIDVGPHVAQVTRVCSYDRAGLGYSDSSPRPRTSKVMAEELHTLLQNAGITGPVILVGHSMGGYDVRLFASLYRNEVAAMVLDDASHPEQQKRFPPALNDLDAGWIRDEEFLEFTMPLGIPRLMGFCGHDAVVRAAECNFHSAREGVAELKTFSQSAAQTATAGSLLDPQYASDREEQRALHPT